MVTHYMLKAWLWPNMLKAWLWPSRYVARYRLRIETETEQVHDYLHMTLWLHDP